MRQAQKLGPGTAAALAVACLAAGGCKADLASEIVLVVQTDMSLNKDIDTIDIQASDEGASKFGNCFDLAGNPCNSIRLPATLGLLQPSTASTSVTVEVDARLGGPSGTVRVFRQITTTVPSDRIVTMQMSIDFLCLGTAVEMQDGSVASTCPMGQTCIAGSCVAQAVDSGKLELYGDGSSVFGPGTCFDGASCWSAPAVADLDMTTCSIPAQKDVNVALQTEGVGICGPVGCFVTLNANDPVEGWTESNGRIDLPPAVCTQITQGKIVDVVTTPVTSTCGEKSTSLPTCGPWSSVKKNAVPYAGPLTIAGGQAAPVALSLDLAGNLYWINGGLDAGTDGTVKSVGPTGGTPTLIAGAAAVTPSAQTPRDMLVTGTQASPILVWSSATPANAMGAPTGTIYKFLPDSATPGPTPVFSKLASPEGVAVSGANLFWTDYQTQSIFMGSLNGAAAGTLLTKNANYPVRIVADSTYVYWTDEGVTGMTPGAVESFDYTTMTQPTGGVLGMVSTPRAIALETGANGTAAVWYATFEQDGTIVRVPVTAGVFGKPIVVAASQVYPDGIAIDGTNVYWTTRGSGATSGAVQFLALGAAPGTVATSLAGNQLGPGHIAVDDTYVYWVNAGTSVNPTGGVIKVPKP